MSDELCEQGMAVRRAVLGEGLHRRTRSVIVPTAPTTPTAPTAPKRVPTANAAFAIAPAELAEAASGGESG